MRIGSQTQGKQERFAQRSRVVRKLDRKTDNRSLGDFCRDFGNFRKDMNANRHLQVISLLVEFFGEERTMDSITPADAEKWRNWLRTTQNRRVKCIRKLSENTVRRYTGIASQIFRKAVAWKLLRENPFDGLEKSVRENPERMHFVSWEDMLKVIAKARTVEWRCLLAFIRLTGCRVPSDIYDLRWSDLDFRSKKITFRLSRTNWLSGRHQIRVCPMFVELVPFLQELAEEVGLQVSTSSDKVFPIVNSRTANIGGTLRILVRKAGLKPWPKLLQNLRSSRQIELMGHHPVKEVCDWFGNSPATFAKHYALPRGDSWQRAITMTTVSNIEAERGE